MMIKINFGTLTAYTLTQVCPVMQLQILKTDFFISRQYAICKIRL